MSLPAYLKIFSLEGKNAVITGAASEIGIGAAVAMGLASAGANVILADCVPSEEVAKNIRERTGREAISVICDVRSQESVDDMIGAAADAFKHIDILVNNAATSTTDYVRTFDMDMDDYWGRIIDVNLTGGARCTRAVTRHMMDNGIEGSVIFTSSVQGLRPLGAMGGHAYDASKAGVISFAKGCALEFADWKIRFNAVCPGLIETNLTEIWWRDRDSFKKTVHEIVPMGKAGAPEDVVGTYVYLASDASKYTTGAVIAVDGGLSGSVVYSRDMYRGGDPVLEKYYRTPTGEE